MTDPFVPDRGPADPSRHTCMYRTNPNPGCGAPGTWHVQWDTRRQSITCDEHMDGIRARWVYTDRHPLSPDCGMPNACWLPDRCEVPGTPTLTTATAAARPDDTTGAPR
jgi:hypothetical protein